ncbi:GerAB/ArcD/ProY family transporter [Crassaminicella profunda]|uniref:GerAB/ArcD/ProY family transporter n=1 Tax=Crassaminicella profunda TaxID=1286698 RepID=UPI001CA6A9B3|nr:endospore germination permease [Crassaminicella profunda]QZY55467.1 spore germination protein [Crassaminicella profunda]
MERNNDKISSFQLGLILAVTMIGVGILTLPRTLTEVVGPDGWVVLLLAAFIALVIALVIAVLVKKFPQETVVEFSSSLIGKPLGMIISIGFFIYCILFSAMEVRIFGEITKEYLLLNTPIEVLMITLLLAAVYLIRSGIEPIARMAQIIFPVVVLIAVVIILPVLPELDLTNLLPVLKTPITKIIKAIPIIFFSFVGIELMLLFSAFVIEPQNIKKHVSFAVIMVSAVYMFILIVTVTRFGLVESTHIIWPSLELFKTIDLPGAFIENVEAFIIGIWILSLFMTLVTLYFGGSLIISRILKSKEQNYFVLPILPIIYFIALIPDNIAQVADYMDMISNYLSTFYVILLPILLLVISSFKKRKGGKKSA